MTLDKKFENPIMPIVEPKPGSFTKKDRAKVDYYIEEKLNKLNMVYEEKELDPFVCDDESTDEEESTEEKEPKSDDEGETSEE